MAGVTERTEQLEALSREASRLWAMDLGQAADLARRCGALQNEIAAENLRAMRETGRMLRELPEEHRAEVVRHSGIGKRHAKRLAIVAECQEPLFEAMLTLAPHVPGAELSFDAIRRAVLRERP
jgi:hypothetical protein